MARNPLLWPLCQQRTLNDDSLNYVGCVMGGSAILVKMRSKDQRSRSPPNQTCCDICTYINLFIFSFRLFATINPLRPNSSNCYTMPCKRNLQFSISDILALWRSALSARVPECQKLKMVGYVCMALNIM